MKIAILIPGMEYPGGVERVVSIQANYWAEKGYDVTIVIPSDHDKKSFYPLNENVNYAIVKLPKFPKIKVPKISYYWYYSKLSVAYKNTLNAIDPDVVISTLQGDDYNYIRSTTDKPIIGVNHISAYLRMGGGTELTNKQKARKKRFFVKSVKKWKQFNAIVTLNRTDAILLRNMGCNTFFIPNPCSFLVDDNKIGIDRPKRVVCVGRLDYVKGQDRLLQVWKRIIKNNPDWKLLFVGDGEKREDILSLEDEFGVVDSVEHIYSSNNVKSILMESSIFAFASRTEAFGMVLIEAFSCGLPVVSYDCESGPRDFVDSYYNGFLIPDDNLDYFANRLELLMKDETLREGMRKNAYATACRAANDVVMSQWDDLINMLS